MTSTETSAEAADQARLEEFMGQLTGYLTGAAAVFGITLGDELGLYQAMAGQGPVSAGTLAARTGCNPRLVREWLDGQAASALIRYDPDGDTYTLGDEAAMALADEASPAFVARGLAAFSSMHIDLDKIKAAFTGDGALAWGDHDPALFRGTEWFFRSGYHAYLPDEWIPALDGAEAKLQAGARVADIGCGHGAAAVVMAQAYPDSHIWGFDYHSPSIQTAQARAREASVADRTTFEVATAKNYPGTYDLLCFFDCLHDMGDPVGIASYAREHLDPDGTVMLVEPFALDTRAANQTDNPLAAALYTASMAVCTPNSLSQEVGLGLGAQAGEARLREVFEQAGFTRFRRAATSPLNLILEARP